MFSHINILFQFNLFDISKEKIPIQVYFQRIGVDLSDEELKTVTLADSDIIKIEKPVDDGEDPFEDDDDPFGDDEK